MAFTRKALAGLGLDEEKIEKVMTLHGTSMKGFIPESELQAKIDEAVEKAKEDMPKPNIKESQEYKDLESEYSNYKQKTEATGTLKENGVKDKFIDTVFSMLDHEKTIEEQLSGIKDKYEEYFEESEGSTGSGAEGKPQFGAGTAGSVPKGDGKSFGDFWGFVPEKK